MRADPPTVRIARWSAVHPWRAMGAWLLLVVAAIVVGNVVGVRQATDLDGASGEWGRAAKILDRGNFDDPATESVLITAREGRLDTGAARAAAADVAARLRAVPEVASVDAPVTAPDGSALLVGATLRGDPATAVDRVGPLQRETARVASAYPQLRVEQVGGASLQKALDDTLGKDFQRAELLSVPLTLLILVVAFGALVAAAVPVLLALSAVAAALGLSALTSQLLPASDAMSSVVLLIGLAVGVDYSLFYIRREREERARGRGHVDAVEIAAATSGHAVVVSGLAVIVSMAGLFLANEITFSSIASGAILVVAVAVAGSLTVLPALLARLGRWVDRPRVPVVWRLTAARPGAGPRVWPAVLRPVLRRPAVTLAVATAGMVALAVPAFGMRLQLLSATDLPRSIPIVAAYDRLVAAFPSEGTVHVVAVEAPASRAGEVRAALQSLAQRTASDPLFAHDREPELRQSADRTVTSLTVGVPSDAASEVARDSLRELRTTLVPRTVGAVDGASYAVGGETAGNVDFIAKMRSALPLVVGFVLLLTFLVMLATFRSVAIAVTAIVLNALSAGAAFGILVLTFQHRWAEGLLGFQSNGAIVAWLPLMLFVILFGLSMDYHVFVVSRVREAAMAGMPTRQAVAQGVTSSAGVVTSAAIVMVAVFSVFATLSTLDMKQLGVGLAAAILFDATVVRAVLLPSAMAVLGRWNWWAPRWLPGGRAAAPPAVAPVDGAGAPPAAGEPVGARG